MMDAVATRIERWRGVLDPADEEWPVFPSLSKGHLRQHLAETDAGAGASAALDSGASVRARLDAFADAGVTPPAISSTAGRKVMQRLTETAGIDVEEGYLQPHGGRRGLGDVVYDDDPVAAQDVLRHGSIETTHGSYREQKAQQRAADLEDIVDQ